MPSNVDHPAHYNQHPSGIECIDIIETFPYNIGVAIKYLWRAKFKNGIEDLEKAIWSIRREIERLDGSAHEINFYKQEQGE